jgi:hypothetical protein
MSVTDELWLPEGHHWDLHIEHRKSSNDAGSFTGGGWKWVLHTTEGGSYDSNVTLLRKVNTPHLVFGAVPGSLHWYVAQLLPFNVAGKTLQNDSSDGYQTNRANAIQMEIVGFTSQIPDWSDVMYKRLANLFVLIQHRVNIPAKAPMDFSSKEKLSDAEWVKAAGILGHIHAPDNDHGDPYRLREGRLLELINDIPAGGYDL